MLSIQMLISGLENKLVHRSIGREWLHDIKGILMPDSDGHFSEQHIYFCTSEMALHTLSRYDGKTLLTLFVAGKIPKLGESPPKMLNLIVFELTLPELYNILYRNYNRYCFWRDKLGEITMEEGNTKKLLQTAVMLSESRISLYLLTPTFKMIDSCIAENQVSRLSRRLNDGRYLTEFQIAQCFEYIATGQDEITEGDGNKISYQMYPVKLMEDIQGYLLVIGTTAFSGFNELIKLLTSEISKCLTRSSFIGSSRREMMKIMEDIFLFMPEDIEGIRSRLDSLPNKPKKYMRSIIISFNREIPVSRVVSELEVLFPDGIIAPYASHVVALVSGDSHLFAPEFDAEKFNRLLQYYNGFAVISNAARYLRGLRTLFIQSKSALTLLPKLLGDNDSKRFAYFELIREYYIIHLCAEIITEHYGHDKLVYLIHPAVIELVRYDMANNTDMRDFLFAYIASDCSILNTANKLHMHRNTVMYRLKKIQDIIGLDLHDFTLRRELMFSCQVMNYTERIQNRNFSIDHSITEH